MATFPVMILLDAGIPPSLLCDLVARGDPESAAINLAERPPNDPLLLETAVENQPRRLLDTYRAV